MTDVLREICDAKRDHVAERKRRRPADAVLDAARAAAPPRGFAARLRRARADGRYGLIAEIKRASPSKGLIRKDFDPARLARQYAAGGAACLSVLTDTPYFQGADEHLSAARAAVDLPVLRKDFTLDPYQVAEARAIGADCILLIVAALEDDLAGELAGRAREFGMDVLVEVHDEDELGRALAIDDGLIGINNRNLKTLETDIATARRLAPLVPADRLTVGESGLSTPADLAAMEAAGVTTFLIGEALMRRDDVKAATETLLRRGARSDGMAGLSHLDAEGRAAMVDVSDKDVTERTATARGTVSMAPGTVRKIAAGGVAKGDVLTVARLAGIMAAKRTSELIPLCHPLALTAIEVDLRCDEGRGAVDIEASCRLAGRTGVEMEALSAVSVAALTVYDMCKAADRGMRIGDIRLVRKTGGRSGVYEAC